MKTKPEIHLRRSLMLWVLLCFSLTVQAEELAAELDWAQLHYASVPVEGFVDEVLVQVGQRVNKGDKLLQLNTTVLSANAKQAHARIAGLQPVLTDAKREYRDAQALYEQTVLSDVELQRAKMSFAVASAKLAEAEAMLAVNNALLARTAQFAPWDGWVIERHLEHGQVIVGDVRSQPLIILGRADSMVAQAYASADTCSRLVVGQALKVRYREKVYSGTLQSMAVIPRRDKNELSYALRVEFAVDPATLLRPGDNASLLLP